MDIQHGNGSRISRRGFLFTAGFAAGALVMGIIPAAPAAAQDAKAFAPNQFLRMETDGSVTLILPFAEMGQGILTGCAMLIAEELEVDLASVRVELAPGDDGLYGSPLFGDQITGGSGSMMGGWISLRRAAAAARSMMIAAAAQKWTVDPTTCRAELGQILHPDGRVLKYGELLGAAAAIPVPQDVALKTGPWRVLGQSAHRLDTPAKVNGSAIYGCDVRLPGMVFAAVANAPVIAGKLISVDPAPALVVKDVLRVIPLDTSVAVVASHTGAALKGLAALSPTWDQTAGRAISTEALIAASDRALTGPSVQALEKGDVLAAMHSAAKIYDATYRLPMLAHAAMEPINCTVAVGEKSCELWLGTQVPGHVRKVAAATAGLPEENVRVNSHLIGGGFGRKLETDWIAQAVEIGKAVGAPVKVMWSREEDMRNDAYRFHNHSRVQVALDAAGEAVAWHHHVAAPGVMFRFLPGYTRDGVDLDAVDGAAAPYTIANQRVDFVRSEAPSGLMTGNWRGVGPTRNWVITEGVVDDIARMAGADPLAWRRQRLTEPRLRAVLDRLESEAGWSNPKVAGLGRGVALGSGFGSHIGAVAEVTVDPEGFVRVSHVTCVIDCGLAINPVLVTQQLEGSIVFGLTAVLFGKVTVHGGRIDQSNFHDYRLLRMAEMPGMKTVILDATGEPGGVGEPGTAVIMPAVLNAIADATGERIRTLPIDPRRVPSIRLEGQA